MWERANLAGAMITRGLTEISGPEIAGIRGIGLLLGVEFHDAATAHRFVAETIARGVIINWTLNADRVVRIAPPLTISEDEIEFALNAMKDALAVARADT
jgi:putrescine aminotransferase